MAIAVVPLIRPVKELALLQLLLKVAAVLLSVNVPLPVSDATVWAKLAISKVPEALMTKAFVESNAFVTPLVILPPTIVVEPILLLATFKVKTPVPVFVKLLPLAPLIAVVAIVILAGPAPLVSIVNALPPIAMPPVSVNVAAEPLVACSVAPPLPIVITRLTPETVPPV